METNCSAIAIGAVALIIGLAGCGSGSDSTEETTGAATTTEATTAETTKAEEKTEEAPPSDEPGEKPSIVSYIKENDITQAPVTKGEPGAPTVDIPAPDGWSDIGPENTPPDAYEAFVYTGPNAQPAPPRIIVWYQKLTGDVDPQKVLDVAGGSLRNLPGWNPMNDGQTSEIGDYKAVTLGGVWTKDGQQRLATQKTVVMPTDDAVYILQFNVMGHPNQFEIVGLATADIDANTKIGAA